MTLFRLPLHIASIVLECTIDSVYTLLRSHRAVDEQDIKWLCQSVSLRGELFQKMLEVDQFLLACEAGSTAYFESLMDRSVDAVKLASNNNWFFFRYACTRGHVGLVRFLSAKDRK